MSKHCRVLVTDDSIVFRKVVRDALSSIDGVDVVGHAENGEVALRLMEELNPDLMTLDIEMPKLNGLEVLREIRARKLATQAIVVSSLTSTGAHSTNQALRLGAFDFILKPSGTNMTDNVERLRTELEPRVAAFNRTRTTHLDNGETSARNQSSANGVDRFVAMPDRAPSPLRQAPAVVAIGASTGGPAALNQIMPKIPADFPLPILIVQHMPPMFTKSLADDLNRQCKIEIREASGGERLEPGKCWIAPGGKQMKVVRTSSGVFTRVTDDPPEFSCRPSVDFLFRSVNQAFQGRAIAVVMTGMGDDGSRGVIGLRANGATVIAQDAQSCTVFGMPRCVIETGNADIISTLDDIPNQIAELVGPYGAALC